MNRLETLKEWIEADSQRMAALRTASKLSLPGWSLAAGFVRNLAWDKFHCFDQATPLNDIDLIYFDPDDVSKERDREIEQSLGAELPWSVKNQARMHSRNQDPLYLSAADAMTYWVEVETAVGACLNEEGALQLIAPFGVESLFSGTISLNPKRPKIEECKRRIQDKRWLELWSKLKIADCGSQLIV